MAQSGSGVDTVQLGHPDQRVDGGSPFAARVGASKQVVAATDGNATQSAFCCGVVNLDPAIAAVASQRGPQIEGAQDRRRRIGLARELLTRAMQLMLRFSISGLASACRACCR